MCLMKRHFFCKLRGMCIRNCSSKAGTSTCQRKVFSGIQPTGALHLGNYVGAVSRWVDYQNNNEDVTLSIVDMHSITLPQDPEQLRHNTMQMIAALIACGINPQKSTLFLQSMVPQHSELCWVLTCLTTMARLGHLPQYKEKSSKLKEIPLGLYVYPVLQAADILLYKATHIPVGEDQVQHLQLAQNLAKIFNKRFGKTFPHPQAVVGDDSSSRLKSLRDPMKKMSKSDPDPKSCIMLTDEPEIIIEKMKKAITDFTSKLTYEPEARPSIANLITMHSLISKKSPEVLVMENSNVTTGEYKLVIAEELISILNPLRKEINLLMADPDYLMTIITEGSEKASVIAESTWREVKEKIGLGGVAFSSLRKSEKKYV